MMTLRAKNTIVFATNARDTKVLLPVSDLTDFDAICHFLRFPSIAKLTNGRAWEDVPDDGIVLFARKYRVGFQEGERRIGSLKKKQLQSFLDKLRRLEKSRGT